MSEQALVDQSARRRSVFWITIAFAALGAGVLLGGAFHRLEWALIFPIAGFIAYLMAFCRGLSCHRDYDLIWRESPKRSAPRSTEPRTSPVLFPKPRTVGTSVSESGAGDRGPSNRGPEMMP